MFTTTYMKKAVAKLKQKSFPKLLLVTFPILIILEMITPYRININKEPKNQTLQKIVEYKSVCFSGK